MTITIIITFRLAIVVMDNFEYRNLIQVLIATLTQILSNCNRPDLFGVDVTDSSPIILETGSIRSTVFNAELFAIVTTQRGE